MALHTLAIDIGKHSFHAFGVEDDGVVISRKVSRAKLAATVDHLDPKVIAMEACSRAHRSGTDTHRFTGCELVHFAALVTPDP